MILPTSSNVMYILPYNIVDPDSGNLAFWFETIKEMSPKAPILLAATYVRSFYPTIILIPSFSFSD